MKTIAKVFVVIYLLSISSNLLAQNPIPLFNEEKFNKAPRINLPSSGEKSGMGKLRIDLSVHSPLVLNQGNNWSCVPYAMVYGAFGTEIGIIKDERNKQIITSNALSPMYVFKKLKANSCDVGLDIEETADYIENRGLLKFTDLPTNNCFVKITDRMEALAQNNKPIKVVQPLNFKSGDPFEKKYQEVLKILEKENKPVIAGLYLVNSKLFKSLNSNNFVYDPTVANNNLYDLKNNYVNQHAVTVVGFDKSKKFEGREVQGAFKILNSYGEEWGDNGYCWIPFEEFGRSIRVAYYLVLNDDYTNAQGSTSIRSFGGEFGYQYMEKIDNGKFIKAQPYHVGNGVYELNKKNWQVGQNFQITTKNNKSGQSICVFSIDTKGKIELHWPFSYGMDVKDQMPNKNTEMVIPNEDNALFIEVAGTDNLIVLFSETDIISNWTSIKSSIENSKSNPDIVSRLRSALSGRMIEASEINYSPTGMNFTTNATRGDIVPVVLKIQSVN